MADSAGRESPSYEIYWTKDDSVYSVNGNVHQLRSFAPGVDPKPSNKRRQSRRKVHQPILAPTKLAQGGKTKELAMKQDKREETEAKKIHVSQEKPSLKDLRPEDKIRVANLIRELAKVGEEKEVIVEQLNVERRTYEDKVRTLQEQMSSIVNEREMTQRQYLECQKLLAEYQSQLKAEQVKVTVSPHPPPKHTGEVQMSPLARKKHETMSAATTQTHHRVNRRETPGHQPPIHANTSPFGYQNGYRQLYYPPSRTSHQEQPGWEEPFSAPYPLQKYQNAFQSLPDTQPLLQNLDFNPLLASTHRTGGGTRTDAGMWSVPANSTTPAMYVSNGTRNRVIIRPGVNPHLPQGTYPTGSQEPMSSSDNFRPLQPDFGASQGSSTPDNIAWNDDQRDYHDAGGTSLGAPANQHRGENGKSGGVRGKPTALSLQKEQLHREKAWLKGRLHDQEQRLLEKQHQLEQRKRVRGGQGVPLVDATEWDEPNLYDGRPWDHAPSGSETDSDDITASTNFPPSNWADPSPALIDSLRKVSLDRGGVNSRDRTTTSSREERDWERIEGYASLYPDVRTRRNVKESTSSSTLSSPAPSHPVLVDQSTSPIHHPAVAPDRPTVYPGRNLSPGKVNVTLAPQNDGSANYNNTRRSQRFQDGQRAVVPHSRTPRKKSYNVEVKKRNMGNLSQLIDEMESSPASTAPSGLVSTGYRTDLSTRPTSVTPDLFHNTQQSEELQESQILEDVFFL